MMCRRRIVPWLAVIIVLATTIASGVGEAKTLARLALSGEFDGE